jgi:5-methylcytosine-specific restriction protein A
MKMMNFRSFDPDYEGEGLKASGRTDRLVWDELASDRALLHNLAASIRAAYGVVRHFDNGSEIQEDQEESFEGGVLIRLHTIRERNRRLVVAKKRQALREIGQLRCEVCNFEFEHVYGARGRGFIECHHIRPLHTLRFGLSIKLKDLAIVCANCHRMMAEYRSTQIGAAET